MRTSSGVGELLVELRRDSGVPLHQQLEGGIRTRIRAGLLRADTVMPSTRALAQDLGLSRGVVVEAYQQLVAEGYLVSRGGGYTQVADIAVVEPTAAKQPVSGPPRIDFRYSRPDVSQFPRAAWLRSIRRVLNETPYHSLAYLDGRGTIELRTALSDYLNRVRGTEARPENMLICNGFAQGSRLLLQVLAAHGYRRLAVEDPSDNDLREVAAAAGLEAVGVPVLESGIDVDGLERSGADVVLVTAAHQFPTGAVASAETRAALVAWAGAAGRDRLVIEDDYDAEYRYDREPIGSMQGLAPDRVAYAGTASKTLAPGLRLGWLILPSRLVEPMSKAKLMDDRGSPVFDQLAFADFVARGEFDRHLRRMRPRYRLLRDTLVERLAARVPELEPVGVSAGLHVMAFLPPDLTEAALEAAARERGVGVYGLAAYWVSRQGPPGLVFGYGSLTPKDVVEGIDLLAEAIGSLRS